MMAPLTRRRFIATCTRGALACTGCGLWSAARRSQAQIGELQKGYINRRLSPYYSSLDDLAVRCELCPHRCEVEEGQRGLCGVRENVQGRYYSLVYANPCALNVDPVEKKPFYHVLPGSRSFSLATAGCNLECKFCQNWEISQARPDDTYNYRLSPSQVVELALRHGCRSVAATYVEPTIFMEYMLAIGQLTNSRAVLSVMHSNGYVNPGPLADLCTVLDAACIDLKGFTESYYREMTGGTLAPVLATLKQLKASRIHTEIVNLVIPGKNDQPHRIQAMCRWICQELGPQVPLHFSRFYPRYKLKSVAPTPVATLESARRIAMAEGLQFVYIGNVPEHPGGHTYCPQCAAVLIRRVGYLVTVGNLDKGRCKSCGRPIPGIWEQPERS